MNWIIFCLIMISLCKSNKLASRSTEKSSEKNLRRLKKTFIIALSLAVVLGLGWGFGLAVTSSDLVELTFTLQFIFSIFVGSQGVLIFFLHGVRNENFRNFWLRLCQTDKKTYNSTKRNTSNMQQHHEEIDSNHVHPLSRTE